MALLQFADAGRLKQAYILSSPQRSEGVQAARRLAAAAVCTSGGAVPCMKCRGCRKALEGIHPDVIALRRPMDDKGRAKKEITVDQIRAMSADAYVLPNEAARKAYIIEDADMMNVQAQNAALKLLEEPPAGVMFILCVENSQLLLPTIRSRCAELSVAPGSANAEDDAESESAKLARAYFKAVATGSRAKLCSFCFANDSLDLRAAADFIDAALELDADILCKRKADPGLGTQQLMHIYELLRRCEARLRVNTGVKHIFGLLAVDSLRGGQ